VLSELKHAFRPEFLNRLDETVLFKPLIREEISKILDLMLASIEKRLSEREIKIHLYDTAKALILKEGYDPAFGARPLKRYLQRGLETTLARALIAGEINDGDTVSVVARGGELAIEKEDRQREEEKE